MAETKKPLPITMLEFKGYWNNARMNCIRSSQYWYESDHKKFTKQCLMKVVIWWWMVDCCWFSWSTTACLASTCVAALVSDDAVARQGAIHFRRSNWKSSMVSWYGGSRPEWWWASQQLCRWSDRQEEQSSEHLIPSQSWLMAERQSTRMILMPTLS